MHPYGKTLSTEEKSALRRVFQGLFHGSGSVLLGGKEYYSALPLVRTLAKHVKNGEVEEKLFAGLSPKLKALTLDQTYDACAYVLYAFGYGDKIVGFEQPAATPPKKTAVRRAVKPDLTKRKAVKKPTPVTPSVKRSRAEQRALSGSSSEAKPLNTKELVAVCEQLLKDYFVNGRGDINDKVHLLPTELLETWAAKRPHQVLVVQKDDGTWGVTGNWITPLQNVLAKHKPSSLYLSFDHLGKLNQKRYGVELPVMSGVAERSFIKELAAVVFVSNKVQDFIADLRRVATAAQDAYHNGETFNWRTMQLNSGTYKVLSSFAGGKYLTDEAYDTIEVLLKVYAGEELPELNRVGAPVPSNTKKVRAETPFPMPSLNKANAATLSKWLDKNPGPYVASLKIDGVSLGLRQDSKFLYVTTRGDGSTGGDISFMAPYMKGLPKKLDAVGTKVRAEVVMHNADFVKYSDGFSNPRNLISGITNRNDVHPALASARVYAYDLVEPRVKPSMAFKMLKEMGFHVPTYKVFPDGTTADEFLAFLKEAKKQSPYSADGLVIVTNKVNPAPTARNPSYAVALKDATTAASAETVVTEVEWRLGAKTGVLFPRVKFEPVTVGGVNIAYASGKSAAFIEDNLIGPGAVIRIARAGDVIPDIRDVVKPASKAAKPSKSDAPEGYHRKGANYYLGKA